jgi:hypothetical protein
MTDIVLYYLMAFAAASTFEMWWFTTGLPVHVTRLLRKAGWKYGTSDFWPDELDYKYWTRSQWVEWLTERNPKDVPAILQEGLTCPGCFSTHASYIAAFIISLSAPFNWLEKLAFTAGGAILLPCAVVLSLELITALRRSGRKQINTAKEEAP